MKKGWEEVELEKYIRLIDYRGRTPIKTESGVRLITAKNVKLGFLQLEPQEFINTLDYEPWMTRGIPNKGDIIFTTEAPLANVAQIETDEKLAFAQRIIVMQPRADKINQVFLKYLLLSPHVRKKILDNGTGATVVGIKSKLLKKIQIPIPPLQEQKRIVAILDKAFATIAKAKANAEQNLKNAKELFESYLQGVFENKGEGWEEFTLKEICTKITDGVHKKPNYLDQGIPFIKIKNLTCDSGISFDNVSYISIEDHEEFCKRTKPEKGDLLITKDGTIGIVRIIETDIEFSIFVSVALIKPKNKNISPYLKYVFESPYIQEQIKPKGAALKHLYLKDLREYLIPIPPEVEQRSIVKKLDALSTKTKKLEAIYQQKIEDLEELKKSVLQKAFNGEL